MLPARIRNGRYHRRTEEPSISIAQRSCDTLCTIAPVMLTAMTPAFIFFATAIKTRLITAPAREYERVRIFENIIDDINTRITVMKKASESPSV